MRIDYEPDRGTSSLALRAFRDGSWVGSAFVSPRLGRDNGQLQRVIDVLTERGTDGRALSSRLRAEHDGPGEPTRAVIGDAEAEFSWPGRVLPDGGAHAPPVEDTPAPRAEPWYPPSSGRDAPLSEVFASRADLGDGESRGPEISGRSAVVRLPNGTALVLPAAPDAPLSHLLGRTLASSSLAVQAVRRHAEDLLAAAERVRLVTAASVPGLDPSARGAWLRAAQLLVSWRIGDAGSR